MSNKCSKLILSIPRSGAPELKTGFNEFSLDGALMASLYEAGAWFGPRAELEKNENYLQIIPYNVLIRDGQVVRYRRTTSGGEDRLHDKFSIGIGGHIDLADAQEDDGRFSFEETIKIAALREIDEEFTGMRATLVRWCGLLFDDSNEVGRVHLGVVGIWQIEGDSEVQSGEDAIANVDTPLVSGLDPNDPSWETWSALLIPYIQNVLI